MDNKTSEARVLADDLNDSLYAISHLVVLFGRAGHVILPQIDEQRGHQVRDRVKRVVIDPSCLQQLLRSSFNTCKLRPLLFS